LFVCLSAEKDQTELCARKSLYFQKGNERYTKTTVKMQPLSITDRLFLANAEKQVEEKWCSRTVRGKLCITYCLGLGIGGRFRTVAEDARQSRHDAAWAALDSGKSLAPPFRRHGFRHQAGSTMPSSRAKRRKRLISSG
jgi:hypothetical protein